MIVEKEKRMEVDSFAIFFGVMAEIAANFQTQTDRHKDKMTVGETDGEV